MHNNNLFTILNLLKHYSGFQVIRLKYLIFCLRVFILSYSYIFSANALYWQKSDVDRSEMEFGPQCENNVIFLVYNISLPESLTIVEEISTSAVSSKDRFFFMRPFVDDRFQIQHCDVPLYKSLCFPRWAEREEWFKANYGSRLTFLKLYVFRFNKLSNEICLCKWNVSEVFCHQHNINNVNKTF